MGDAAFQCHGSIPACLHVCAGGGQVGAAQDTAEQAARIPPDLATRLGLVVTPSQMPQLATSPISSRSVVSTNSFMLDGGGVVLVWTEQLGRRGPYALGGNPECGVARK
jgi:hypothetical protein